MRCDLSYDLPLLPSLTAMQSLPWTPFRCWVGLGSSWATLSCYCCCRWRMSGYWAGLGSSWTAHCAVRVPDMRFTHASSCLIWRLDTETCHELYVIMQELWIVNLFVVFSLAVSARGGWSAAGVLACLFVVLCCCW